MSSNINSNITNLENARVWPVQEALKVLNRIKTLNKKEAIFETGYGPSGLPHMGTVAEVIRTLMVKKAFDDMKPADVKSTLIAFVDDLDGFRKVPTNVPNQALLTANLNKPLTQVPDPFEQCASFGEYNSKRFAMLLERLGARDKITIYSATEMYKSGRFNSALIDILKYHTTILDIMLATLREERQATYSPFLPISPVTGCVLQVTMNAYNVDKGTISFVAEDGKEHEIPVTDGYCKLQWKPDLGMRWHALGVDYEIYGKDLISTAEIASKICLVLGSTPPEGMHYEHFLSPEGGRVSKSKGNESLTLDNWWNYTPKGCLEHFLFQNPQRAKRMRLEDLPTYVEQFLNELEAYQTYTDEQKFESALFYIDTINTTKFTPVSYKLVLSVACATHAPDFITLAKKLNLDTNDTLGMEVAEKAYQFYLNEVKSTLNIVPIPHSSHQAIDNLIELLEKSNKNAQDLQSCFFQAGKESGIPLGQWFMMLYQALIGTEQGPKLGSFCMMYGIENVINILKSQINLVD